MMLAVTRHVPAYCRHGDIRLLCDNNNLTKPCVSADPWIAAIRTELQHSGACVIYYWLRGKWNTIADNLSRVPQPRPQEALSKEELQDFVLCVAEGLYGDDVDERFGSFQGLMGEEEDWGLWQAELASGEGDPAPWHDDTVVPGHVRLGPLTRKVLEAQHKAPKEEQDSWQGAGYRKEVVGGMQATTYRGRLLVPTGAERLQREIMKVGHDGCMHFLAVERTLHALQVQCRVYWYKMEDDVRAYVHSCVGCQLGKPDTTMAGRFGSLNPTQSPALWHTLYIDIKGNLAKKGYILGVVDAFSRYVFLRFLPKANAKEVIEEMEEVLASMGTIPLVVRTDNGEPFSGHEWASWCENNNIVLKRGVAEHHRGQGMVENRFRWLASALIATLGMKAQEAWCDKPWVAKLERIINSARVYYGGSPAWARNGVEPRTPLTVQFEQGTGSDLEIEGLTAEEVVNLIAEHHGRLNQVQGRVSMATSLAQAITKRKFDAGRKVAPFAVGDWVVIIGLASNKLVPKLQGPYQVTEISADRNFIKAKYFVDKADKVVGPVHVERVLPFDFTRASKMEVAHWQCTEGNGIVEKVLSHELRDGVYFFHIKWFGLEEPLWQEGDAFKQTELVLEYCGEHGLPAPGTVVPMPKRTTRRGIQQEHKATMDPPSVQADKSRAKAGPLRQVKFSGLSPLDGGE